MTKTKKIRVDVRPSGANNVVEMERVSAHVTPVYLGPLERSLAPFRPEHRRGSEFFTIANKPGRGLQDIASAIGRPDLYKVILTERTEEVSINKPKRSKRERLLELDEERGDLRARLKALNKEARNIERQIARR